MNIKGFTLIEQMLVVAVAAILTAIAYPSFKNHFHKARRAEVQSDLYALAAALERYKSEQIFPTYVGATVANRGTGPGAPLPEVFPSGFSRNSKTKSYDLEIY